MTAIDKIVNEIAEAEAVWHKEPIAQLPTQHLKEWADGIRSEYDTLRREALKAINEIASACTEFLKAQAFHGLFARDTGWKKPQRRLPVLTKSKEKGKSK
ncbi:MAG: hypothetical protein II649_06700 [Kiritimatiellae bacterium]|nr:hypothetical protein [Kiritimatiellia bacterium]